MSHNITEEEFRSRLDLRLWAGVVRRALRYRVNLAVLLGMAIVCAACDASFGFITGRLIDAAREDGVGPRLWTWIAVFFGVITTLAAAIWVFIYNAGKISNYLSHDIRAECFAKLQDLSFSYYDKHPVGWLMSRVTSDCNRLSGIIAWGLLDLVWGTLVLLLIALVMLSLNWRLALVVLAVIPPLVLVSLWFQKRILLSSRQMRKTNSLMTAAYNEALMGVRTTKTLVRERQALGEFDQLAEQMHGHSVRNALQSSMYHPLVMTLGAAATGAALWYGGVDAVAGTLTLGTLVAFMAYAGQFFGPIGQMARIITEMQSAQAAGERVQSLLATVPEIRDSDEVQARLAAQPSRAAAPAVADARPGTAPDGYDARIATIAFHRVWFAYTTGNERGDVTSDAAPSAASASAAAPRTPPRYVLRDFNLTVHAGQTIALVGPTGGGKSTIVSLVCRFYEPTRGEILINGVEYRRRSLAWLQSQLGIVLQQPHLFSGTVRQNIRYGRLDASDAEVEQAARLVNAHDFISALEKGYDSEVGEGGNRLSTGQKQLVSFARAVLADPQIFVMDEATSSIDTQTEHLIQQGMAAMLRGRISFVIAHRLSTIRSADLILVIDDGQVTEQGTHAQLLARRGQYHDLYTSHYRMEREKALLHLAT